MASAELAAIKEMMAGVELMSGTLEERRSFMDSLDAAIPDGTTVTPVTAGGVPGEWVVAPEAESDRVILYLHGGGYCMGSLRSHRGLVAKISAEAAARVLSLDYRLAPEHPFPAAVDDAVAAYRWLLAEGTPADRIAIAGDSAGGGLTLATLLALRDEGGPVPAAAVGISPWADLEGTGASTKTRASVDIMLRPEHLKEGADWYANGADLREPRLSPIHGDYSGIPPLLLHVGDAEILLDDSVRVAERARAAGVDVTLEVWDEMPHVFHAFADVLPEGAEAIAKVAAFVKQQIP